MVRQRRGDPEYRALVQQLMDAGWYRMGQRWGPRGNEWGFRAGHTVDGEETTMRWIAAADAKEAMRILHGDLEREGDARDDEQRHEP
jgi:hypothetical protein